MAKLYLQDGNSTSSLVQGDGDTPPSGYTESNTIDDWNYYGYSHIGTYPSLKTTLDLRTILKTLIDAKGFDNCTQSEKEVACKWFIADKTQRDTICSEQQQWRNGKWLLNRIAQDNSELCIFTTDIDTKLAQIQIDNTGTLSVIIL